MIVLVSKLQQLRATALQESKHFLRLYEKALIKERYIAAKGYYESYQEAVGRIRGFDAALELCRQC